jgi:hypothetical protein
VPIFIGLTNLAVGATTALALAAAMVPTASSEHRRPPRPAAGESALVCARPGIVSVPERTSTRFYPPLVTGDPEFSGHGPAVTVSAKRILWSSSTDSLSVIVRMRAEETRSDWTKADGTQLSYTLYTAPPGCHIDASSLPYEGFDANGYLDRSIYPNPCRLRAGDTGTAAQGMTNPCSPGPDEPMPVNPSFVAGYQVYDDRTGPDVQGYTSVRVIFRPFWVRLRG